MHGVCRNKGGMRGGRGGVALRQEGLMTKGGKKRWKVRGAFRSGGKTIETKPTT